MSAGFSGSYDAGDVTFLLKRVSIEPTDITAKEALIQSGARHYSEMLSAETVPDFAYMVLYHAALERNGAWLAEDIVSLAAALSARQPVGEIILVSLARAGTPVGVLLKRVLVRSGREAAHYSVSIIRDHGIDMNALAHIAARHDPAAVVFLDGWTGKGAIVRELRSSLADHPFGIAPFLAVIADPAGKADLAATHDDYLIASGLLNSIVSGLVSRTVLSAEHVGAGDFHACVSYDHLAPHDLSRPFVDHIDGLAKVAAPRMLTDDAQARVALSTACDALVQRIMTASNTTNPNHIKPGIAEATRAVLRRLPQSLWVRDTRDPDVAHLIHMAREKGLAVQPLGSDSHYRAVAVITSLASE
jgi:Phosphoribosyl transferase (PRTase)/PELOTA RNA binding domain